MSLPDQARVLEEVTIKYKNLDGTIETQMIHVNQSVDWHLPLFISQSGAPIRTNEAQNAGNSKAEMVDFKFIFLHVREKVVEIRTKDRLIRHFLMVSPHRVVLDFEREASFLSYEKRLSTLPFTQVRLGNHEGYYRAVLTLDGRYRYAIEPTQEGLRISIR